MSDRLEEKPLSQLRMEVHQEDHPLRALLFGGGISTTDGLLKGENARAQAANILNRVMYERLDLVGEIASARARIAQLEAVAVAAAPFRHDPVQGHSPDICPGCNLAAALDAAALSSPETPE